MNDISLQDIYTIFTELLGLVYLFYRYFTGSDPSIPILSLISEVLCGHLPHSK